MNQYRNHPSGHYGRQRRGGQPPGAGPSTETVIKYWGKDYLSGGYFDQNGNLKTEYVCRENVEPLVKVMCEQRTSLTTHQVRRYFGHCRAIETKLRAAGAAWDSVRPLVCRLDSAAADGAAKQPPKIPELFHDFIRRNVAAVKTKKDFLEGFLPHFEALVGFGQAYFKKDRS